MKKGSTGQVILFILVVVLIKKILKSIFYLLYSKYIMVKKYFTYYIQSILWLKRVLVFIFENSRFFVAISSLEVLASFSLKKEIIDSVDAMRIDVWIQKQLLGSQPIYETADSLFPFRDLVWIDISLINMHRVDTSLHFTELINF